MMKGPFTYIVSVALAVYIGWIVIATTPTHRIARGCEPVSWAGNLVVSMTAFIQPTWEAGTQGFFDRGNYACRYAVWRLVYGAAWSKEHGGQIPAREKA